MKIDISKLKKDRNFVNEKIKIRFSTGEVSNNLSVYLIDSGGKYYHVLWSIDYDRCLQSFDKTNEKVRDFVQSKVNEWLKEEEEEKRMREEVKQIREQKEENKIKNLMELF